MNFSVRRDAVLRASLLLRTDGDRQLSVRTSRVLPLGSRREERGTPRDESSVQGGWLATLCILRWISLWISLWTTQQ